MHRPQHKASSCLVGKICTYIYTYRVLICYMLLYIYTYAYKYIYIYTYSISSYITYIHQPIISSDPTNLRPRLRQISPGADLRPGLRRGRAFGHRHLQSHGLRGARLGRARRQRPGTAPVAPVGRSGTLSEKVGDVGALRDIIIPSS